MSPWLEHIRVFFNDQEVFEVPEEVSILVNHSLVTFACFSLACKYLVRCFLRIPYLTHSAAVIEPRRAR